MNFSCATNFHARRYFAFVHIEKAAGTTFIHILRRNFLLRYLDVRPYSPGSNEIFTARDLELSLRVNPWLCAFGGHAVRPIGDLCDFFPNISFVTILRDPVRRYISQYLYGNAVLKLNLTFDQFLADKHTHNFQTRKIAGEADLSLAKRTLEERFLAVGLLEKFDHFLSTLTERLKPNLFNRAYERRNAGDNPQKEADLIDAYGCAIQEVNRLDTMLYLHVQRMLDADNGDALQDPYRLTKGLGLSDRVKYYVDGAVRRIYYEPVTGLLRLRNGMPMKGSY